ncbi:MAG: glycerol-3-phosphate 1-O-acyltransferase PlsY [Eubacterium sp.]|nr:glycerol-3-phosphate 1-O-acyltransferase PlsY [Eubacterium sp.]
MQTLIWLLIGALISYLIGSLNSSIIMSRILKKDDIRNSGSGNAGATNMVRTYGKFYGVLAFILDFVKVLVAYLIVYLIFSNIDPAGFHMYAYFFKVVTGFFCFIGHIYPCFFGFKGGKGITVCAAVVCLLDWRMFIFGLVTFFAVVFITKYISFSSIAFAVVYPIFTYFLFDKDLSIIPFSLTPRNTFGEDEVAFRLVALAISIVFSIIVLIKHRENIKRLLKGEENKIGSKKKKEQ